MIKNNIDLTQVKEFPIPDILARIGFEPVRRGMNDWTYHTPWREDRNASLHVRLSTNTWKDFAEEKSGTSNIDLVIKLGLAQNWRDAAQWILELRNMPLVRSSAFAATKSPIEPNPSSASIIEVKTIDSEGLYRYGESRGISRSVLQKYCLEITFRSQRGREYTVLGFQNTKGGYVLRMSKWLKCNVGPSTFSYISESTGDEIYVFEGFFDFLSFRELFPNKLSDYLVLNSVVHSQAAAQHIQSRNYSQVLCYLDGDAKGSEALNTFKTTLRLARVVDESSIYTKQGFKDLNEMLVGTMTQIGKSSTSKDISFLND